MKKDLLTSVRWTTSSRQIALLTIGLLFVVWSMLAYWAFNSHHLTLENRKAALAQTVAVVEEQNAQMLSLIRVALLSADHWVARHPGEDPGENKEFIRLIEQLRESSGQRIDIRMATRDAKLAYVPKRADAAVTDISDRDYFLVQSDPATRGFYIANAVFSRVTHKWGIPISVPASNRDGRIAVLFGAIELDRMEKLQTPLLNDSGSSITVLRSDGLVLSRVPVLPEMIGSSLTSTPSWTEYISREKKGIFFTNRKPFAGLARIVAFSHMPDYPLIILATATLDDVLRTWREQLILLVMFALLLSIGFSLMATKLTRAVRAGELARTEVERQAAVLVRTNQELNVLSVTDKLTQVYNRVKLDAVLHAEVSRAKRYEPEFSIIMLDIDHFKRVNDVFGHAVGDSVLVGVATILQNSIRETDTIGRWGGEEFLIILPQTGHEQAVAVAEKIRQAIFTTHFTAANHLTVSIGVTRFSTEDSEEQVLARADTALYEAKNAGRNRVVLSLPGKT
ncbi:MAG: sensor domain-containing diguanylate cyclase [Betaproteobacteria bacterium]